MYEEVLKEQLFDKFEDNSVVAIFGACPAGKRILNDIKKFKKNVKVACFIDNFVKGTFEDLPVYTLKEFIDKNLNCDTVIMSTRVNISDAIHILRIYDYNVFEQSKFLYKYYRIIKNMIEDIMNIFEKQEDKNLYKLLLDVRLNLKDKNVIAEYYDKKFPSTPNFSILTKQYLEKINKNAIKTLIDLGFNSGLNAVAYNRFLPNLEHIYGFDAIYDICVNETIEPLIKNDKLKIIQKCVGSEKGITKFIINTDSTISSRCIEITSAPKFFKNQTEITTDVITLDDFCKENNVYPDLIKMDIEGAEMAALKGGIETIKKCRPQLAISFYHSDADFIEIPLYLKENLVNYTFKLGHYKHTPAESVLYAIPNELKG